MIVASKLKKKYGYFTAVDGISFTVKQGEIFGFLGPNGAGKTSTINMMIGLSRPTEGEIIIDGIDVRRQTKKAQAIMGIVPDVSNLYNEMTGFENLCFCASLYGLPKKEREHKARQLLERFQLTGIEERPFKAYSKGMRRKLTIAAAIIHSPRVLFLDEPTAGIDIVSARQVRELVLGLKELGTTIFVTTHNIEEAERICDRLAFIANGKIVADGSVKELMDQVSHRQAMQVVTDANVGGLIGGLQARFEGSIIEQIDDRSMLLKSRNQIPLLPLVEYLSRHGISVYEAKYVRPSLEDVFISLTGSEKPLISRNKGKGGQKP